MYNYRYTSSAATGLAIGWIIGGLISAIIFGLITRYINKSKGYEGGFAWGFFLSLIGIIVVACKPDNRSYAQASSRNENERRERDLLADGGWKCLSCGRVNNQYTTYCICGKTKDESLNPPKAIPKANTKQTSQNNDVISLIKQLAELHSQGILTDEEFSNKKAALLEKVGIDPSDEEINEEVAIPVQETEKNGWIIDGKDFVICPQCNKRMTRDFIKYRGTCPDCGYEYYR